MCQCQSGFTGSMCEIDVDICSDTLCQNSGSYVVKELGLLSAVLVLVVSQVLLVKLTWMCVHQPLV